jgi:hypothetical protein
MFNGFDAATAFPKLDFRKHDDFRRKIEEIRRFFEEHDSELGEVRARAAVFMESFRKMDPFIQEYTARTCPYCGSVCCANKHGMPDFGDAVAITAMGFELPDYRLDVDINGMCQFMGERGCILPRAQRPYRCTWYYCDPLLKQIEIGPARHYRQFIADVQEMGAARGGVLSAFYEVWKAYR